MSELDDLMARAEEGEEIGDDELDIDLSEAVDVSAFAAKNLPVEVVKATTQTGKASGNKYIKLQLRVIDGDYARRVIFDNVNLKGTGAGFGRQTLDALGAGIDWDAPRVRPSALVGLKAIVDTKIEESSDYPDKTVVKGWKPYVSAAAEDAANLK